MSERMLSLINCSIAAGWIVPVVLLLRLLLKKSPKWIHCLLWSVVGLRLLLPFSVESRWSLLPSAKVLDPSRFFGRIVVQTGIPAMDAPVNTYLASHYYESITVPVGFFDAVLERAFWLWLIGFAVLSVYSLLSTWMLYRKTAVSMRWKENIWFCDRIDTAFILGILRPRICLPSDLQGDQLKTVLRHEKAHIRRKDHLVKPLAYLLVLVHWFNPLMWLAFWAFSRDMELACDEQAVCEMSLEDRKHYSRVLLDCSLRRRKWVACPLAFGEVGVKQRIRSVLFYRKPAIWVKAAALLLCCVIAVCFLTSPLPESRALTLPKGSSVDLLMMNAMHDSLRSKANLESYMEFHREQEIPVSSCEYFDGAHMHYKGTVSTGKRCKICGVTVYDGQVREGVRCSYNNKIE